MLAAFTVVIKSDHLITAEDLAPTSRPAAFNSVTVAENCTDHADFDAEGRQLLHKLRRLTAKVQTFSRVTFLILVILRSWALKPMVSRLIVILSFLRAVMPRISQMKPGMFSYQNFIC